MESISERDAGYIEALDDLLRDGVLTLQEHAKRKETRMSKSKSSPANTIGGSGFGSQTDPSMFDLRAGNPSNTVSFTSVPDVDKTTFNFSSLNLTTSTSTKPNFAFIPTESSPSPSNSLVPSLSAQKQLLSRPYKICILGDGAVGKTSFLQRFRQGSFGTDYQPTVGCEVHTITFSTSQGPITVNVWDTAGKEEFMALRQGYYIGSDAFIIMFDLTSTDTYKKLPTWHTDGVRENYTAPMVLVGNKCDVQARKVKPTMITFHRKHNIQYYDASVHCNYNIEKPFLYFLRKLTGDANLVFTESPVHQPPIRSFVQESNSLGNFNSSGATDSNNFKP